MPVSRTRMTASPAFLVDGERHVAAGVGELAGVVQKVADDLRQSRWVGIEIYRSAEAG